MNLKYYRVKQLFHPAASNNMQAAAENDTTSTSTSRNSKSCKVKSSPLGSGSTRKQRISIIGGRFASHKEDPIETVRRSIEELKLKQAEESLRTVMYLSCWGPNS